MKKYILMVIVLIVVIVGGLFMHKNAQYKKRDNLSLNTILDLNKYLDQYYLDNKIYPSRNEFYKYFHDSSNYYDLSLGGPMYWCNEVDYAEAASPSKASTQCLNISLYYTLNKSRVQSPGSLIVSGQEHDGKPYANYGIVKSCGTNLGFIINRQIATDNGSWEDPVNNCKTPGF